MLNHGYRITGQGTSEVFLQELQMGKIMSMELKVPLRVFQQVQFKSEDYNISFKYQFWFDVYTAYPNWFKGLISFVGK